MRKNKQDTFVKLINSDKIRTYLRDIYNNLKNNWPIEAVEFYFVKIHKACQSLYDTGEIDSFYMLKLTPYSWRVRYIVPNSIWKSLDFII